MRKACVSVFLAVLLTSVPGLSQTWDEVISDDSFVWGEGWGRTLEEADREALRALGSRIDVSVSSDFLHTEDQRTGTSGAAYASHTSTKLSLHSCVRLSNTSRVILREGRKCHVGRWIRRDELEALLSDRRLRVLEYESMAGEAEKDLRIGDALRYHYWAYITLRSIRRPSELRDTDGRMLVVAIPERINAILSGISVKAAKNSDSLNLFFRYNGTPVRCLDFTFFDGQAWSRPLAAKDGLATVRFAPGALGEVIQLRIEYAYPGEAALDDDLNAVVSSADSVPFRKSYMIFRR